MVDCYEYVQPMNLALLQDIDRIRPFSDNADWTVLLLTQLLNTTDWTLLIGHYRCWTLLIGQYFRALRMYIELCKLLAQATSGAGCKSFPRSERPRTFEEERRKLRRAEPTFW